MHVFIHSRGNLYCTLSSLPLSDMMQQPSCCVLDIRYSNKLNVIQHRPESSVENVHLKLTLRYARDHNFHLHPFSG